MLVSRRVLAAAPKVLGSDIKTHLESRFRTILILYYCIRLACWPRVVLGGGRRRGIVGAVATKVGVGRAGVLANPAGWACKSVATPTVDARETNKVLPVHLPVACCCRKPKLVHPEETRGKRVAQIHAAPISSRSLQHPARMGSGYA